MNEKEEIEKKINDLKESLKPVRETITQAVKKTTEINNEINELNFKLMGIDANSFIGKCFIEECNSTVTKHKRITFVKSAKDYPAYGQPLYAVLAVDIEYENDEFIGLGIHNFVDETIRPNAKEITLEKFKEEFKGILGEAETNLLDILSKKV